MANRYTILGISCHDFLHNFKDLKLSRRYVINEYINNSYGPIL